MIDEYRYAITGPALATLLSETAIASSNGLEGFLMGTEELELVKNVTDASDTLKDKNLLSIMIKGFISLNLEQRLNLIDIDGEFNEDKLNELLGDEVKSVVGYFNFSSSEDYQLYPSLRIQKFANLLNSKTISTSREYGFQTPIVLLCLNGTKHNLELHTHQTSFKAFSIIDSLECTPINLKILNLSDFAKNAPINQQSNDKSTNNLSNLTSLIAPSSSSYIKSLQSKMEKPNPTTLISTHNELFRSAFETLKELVSEYLLKPTSALPIGIASSSQIPNSQISPPLLIPTKKEYPSSSSTESNNPFKSNQNSLI